MDLEGVAASVNESDSLLVRCSLLCGACLYLQLERVVRVGATPWHSVNYENQCPLSTWQDSR